MAPRLPALLADPPARSRRLWLTNARLFDGTGDAAREDAAVLVDDGLIVRAGEARESVPEGAQVLDLGGRTLLPGLIDAHAHLYGQAPTPKHGAEPILAGTPAHFLAADLAEMLRMGFTTVRDVGSYGDQVLEARQAMRYGAFRGPRVLTCGRILAATSPGGRFFEGMYLEVDGADDARRGARAQLRRGADFVKVMTTGARSVELEDPDPAQMTGDELAAVVEEAHRLGYRVAAHAEGLAGTELAVQLGADTIEHGMYLHERPDLLERMVAGDQVLVPTLSCFYGVAGADGEGGQENGEWSPLLVDLARFNLEQAGRTLAAAQAAGVRLALGHDWSPIWNGAVELLRMVDHGLGVVEAFAAATAGGAFALGLDEQVGTVTAGKLADLLVVDGDPLADPSLLTQRDRIWLVFRLGEPVAGAALERDIEAPSPVAAA
jgi:imidazolonepropionase-like amidohydrolase